MAERGKRKVRDGVVIKNAMNKTVIVNVERRQVHPLYKRVVKQNSRFMVHDEKNECTAGDFIQIMETRPLSKNKRWRLIKILEKAK